jgi:cysteine synthase B
MPDQYNNSFNPKAHEDTTAQEIWQQTQGKVTHVVAGIGTGGTVMGTGRGLKTHNAKIQVIAVEPEGSLHGLEGMKHMASSIVPGIYKEIFLDRKIPVETEDAYQMVRRLSKEEGLLVGQSSGAVLWGVFQVAKTLKEGLVVGIFPDGGDKYLSTRVWE